MIVTTHKFIIGLTHDPDTVLFPDIFSTKLGSKNSLTTPQPCVYLAWDVDSSKALFKMVHRHSLLLPDTLYTKDSSSL